MIVLAVDTALSACSATIYDAERGHILASYIDYMDKGHAEALPPMVERTVANSKISFNQVDRIAVTNGPGTFTGVRIGMSFAHGLGLALDRPIVAVSTLVALAANLESNVQKWPVATAIAARNDKVYFQIFSHNLLPQSPAQLCTQVEAAAQLPADTLVIGSGSLGILNSNSGKNIVALDNVQCCSPNSSVFAKLAAMMPASMTPPQAVFLRQSDARPSIAGSTSLSGKSRVFKAENDHAALLAALHGESFAPGWDTGSFAKLMSMPGSLAFIVTSSGDEPAGFILATVAADEADIVTIAVRPSERRRRLATRLISAFTSHLADQGVSRLYIEVAQSNEPASTLYSKLGFVKTGVRKNYYDTGDSQGRHAYTMMLPLRKS